MSVGAETGHDPTVGGSARSAVRSPFYRALLWGQVLRSEVQLRAPVSLLGLLDSGLPTVSDTNIDAPTSDMNHLLGGEAVLLLVPRFLATASMSLPTKVFTRATDTWC